MIRELRQAILFTAATMVLFGGVYPLVVWSIGCVAFADQAQGSLIRRADGSVAGSRLIGQAFTQSKYFHPRPSGVDYNAASTGGTNDAGSNPDHLKTVADRLAAVTAEETIGANAVPSEMVTASGAGLDPHITPDAADRQVNRVAVARGATPERIREIVGAHTEAPVAGFLGRPRINVLELNLALDRSLAIR